MGDLETLLAADKYLSGTEERKSVIIAGCDWVETVAKADMIGVGDIDSMVVKSLDIVLNALFNEVRYRNGDSSVSYESNLDNWASIKFHSAFTSEAEVIESLFIYDQAVALKQTGIVTGLYLRIIVNSLRIVTDKLFHINSS